MRLPMAHADVQQLQPHIWPHGQRVARLAGAVGAALRLSPHDLATLQLAALVHDVGKAHVPAVILDKPGPLTAAEYEQVKRHAAAGADFLSRLGFSPGVLEIVRHHHENWDGTGYPDRIRATTIPLGARILAVVDCFDALTSDRAYRPRLTRGDALTIVRAESGYRYDPTVVKLFAGLVNVRGPFGVTMPARIAAGNALAA